MGEVKWSPVVVVKLPGLRGHQFFRPKPFRPGSAFHAESYVRRTLEWLEEEHPDHTIVRIEMFGSVD